MTSFSRNVSLFVCFLLMPLLAKGQAYEFKIYDSGMGLPQNFIYSLAQGKNGYVWMGSGEGLVKFDGIKFQTYGVNDSLNSDFVRSMFVDSAGDLWLGHDNGTMTVQQKTFKKLKIEGTSSPIRNISEDLNGNIWAVEQNNGLICINNKLEVKTFFDRLKFGRRLYYSIQPIASNVFLVGTSDGLIEVVLNENLELESINEIASIPMVGINSITPRNNVKDEYWIATEDKGFFLFQYNTKASIHVINNSLCLYFNIENESITDIVEDLQGNLLLGTWGNGVIKLLFDPISGEFTKSLNFNQANGLSNDYVKDILADREGNYWFATYGGGVSSLLNDQFVYYQLSEIGFKSNKVGAVIHAGSDLWMGLDNGLLKADPFCFANHEFYDAYFGLPSDAVTGFYTADDGTLFVGTQNKGLYKKRSGSLKFEKYNYTNSLLGNQINDIEGADATLYIATMGGLFIIDLKTKEITQLTTEKNLPHNNINFVFKDQLGQIWIGPKSSGICKIDNKNFKIEVHRLDETPVDVSDLTEDLDGNLWLATRGKGVIKYTEDTLIVVSVLNGLAKNFCHSIVCDNQNRLWVSHHPGLSCIDLNTMKVRTFGYNNNLGGDFQQIWKDRDNTLWLASSDGVIHYFPDRDQANLVGPILNFTNVSINGTSYPSNESMNLPFPYRNNYSFKFDFIGISLRDPLHVTYKYKLVRNGDNETAEWVDLGTVNTREYEYLPDGDYILKIIAFNSDGVASNSPLTFSISIAAPFWKRIWFYLLVTLLGGYVIYLFVRMREQKLIHQKQILQREVANQTVQLRMQKAEIERKNRDITDSINYAKRIQSSILPPISLLKSVFPESFIFFAPRDIVSGDFYWFNQSREFFTISIADCTGHGVPGAFMSMIGSTLLNDIYKNQHVNSPAEMLEHLDREIKVLLQKNSVNQTQDGMDISIVEIHLPTRRVRLASAKRPVLLYTNNELSIYKGNRRSIGESLADHSSPFINIEYELEKGDCIYLYSDGYTDQFGGPAGKKFMKVGAQNLLDEIRHLPMATQYQKIQDTFANWMGELEQVDDVIFLGIRV